MARLDLRPAVAGRLVPPRLWPSAATRRAKARLLPGVGGPDSVVSLWTVAARRRAGRRVQTFTDRVGQSEPGQGAVPLLLEMDPGAHPSIYDKVARWGFCAEREHRGPDALMGVCVMPAVPSSWLVWLLVLGAGLSSCAGNLMLKQSRLTAPEAGLRALLLSPWFLGGLA